MIDGKAQPRQQLFGYYGAPGSAQFKVMVRSQEWKYIFIANGGREQLFNLREDPAELTNLAASKQDVARQLRASAESACSRPALRRATDGIALRVFPFRARARQRIYQFHLSRGVKGFPRKPEDVLRSWRQPA